MTDAIGVITSVCVTNCQDGYYNDKIDFTCKICVAECARCVDRDDYCTLCATGFFLENNFCVKECSKGKYGSGGICVSCDSKCGSC